MLIAVDAGNSTVAFGLFEGEDLVRVFKTDTREDADAGEYLAFLTSRLDEAGINSGRVEGAAISSVVPAITPVLSEALGKLCRKPPLQVSAGMRLGVRIGYKTPETLGQDRLAAAAGAYAMYGGPVVVMDFGTATTISVVDGEGTFLGGMIAPGLMTAYGALIDKTSALPRVALEPPKHAVGVTTAEGIQAGVIFGHAAMADGLLARVRAEAGAAAAAVATGGLASMVVPYMLTRVETDENLVLKGLYIIYKLNS